jgi:hypothetical protein
MTDYEGVIRFSRLNSDVLYSIGKKEEDEMGFCSKLGIKAHLEFDDLLPLLKDEYTDLENDVLDWSKMNVFMSPNEVRELIAEVRDKLEEVE